MTSAASSTTGARTARVPGVSSPGQHARIDVASGLARSMRRFSASTAARAVLAVGEGPQHLREIVGKSDHGFQFDVRSSPA